MPTADHLGQSVDAAPSRSLEVLVDIKQVHAGHVGQVLEYLDFYFRWAVAIEESLLRNRTIPPFPHPRDECGLYITNVQLRSFVAVLTAVGAKFDSVDPQQHRGIRLLLAFLTVAGFTTGQVNAWATHSSPPSQTGPATCTQVRLPEVPESLLSEIDYLSRHMKTQAEVDLTFTLVDENGCRFEIRAHVGGADVGTDEQRLAPIGEEG